ncbi:hypothetical protein GBA52_021789 [Prunus armeniaca]|nr:hypothetical protein GBA52_021789 [Prunus armeniaca]
MKKLCVYRDGSSVCQRQHEKFLSSPYICFLCQVIIIFVLSSIASKMTSMTLTTPAKPLQIITRKQPFLHVGGQ